MVTPSRSMTGETNAAGAIDIRMLRAAEEEALGGVAARALEVAELLGGLDALGDHRQPEAWAELDHRVDDRDVLASSAAMPRTNERSIFSMSTGKR